MAGGVSVEDRSKEGVETVRPQHDEHRECQFVFDQSVERER